LIGRSVVEAALAQGATVAGVSRSQINLSDGAKFHATNVKGPASVDPLFQEACEAMGGVDGLANLSFPRNKVFGTKCEDLEYSEYAKLSRLYKYHLKPRGRTVGCPECASDGVFPGMTTTAHGMCRHHRATAEAIQRCDSDQECAGYNTTGAGDFRYQGSFTYVSANRAYFESKSDMAMLFRLETMQADPWFDQLY